MSWLQILWTGVDKPRENARGNKKSKRDILNFKGKIPQKTKNRTTQKPLY